MRKFCTYLFGGVFVLCLTACQSAPDEDIVVNKNEGVLESAIADSSGGSDSETKISETYTGTLEIPAKDYEFVLDADVEYPDVPIPVVRVKPREITMDEVRHWVDVLFEGNTAYEPKTVRTKAEIEERILSLKSEMSDKEKFIEEHGDTWDHYEAMIAALEEEYKTAPESYTRKESDWTFHDWYYYDIRKNEYPADKGMYDLSKTAQFAVETKEGALNGNQGYIVANNRNEDDFKLHDLWFYYKDSNDVYALPDSGMSEEEAFAMAQETKDALGFKDWTLHESFANGKDIYTFRFTPLYKGVKSLNYMMASVDTEDIYSSRYYYEYLEINVRGGRVSGVIWESPVDIVGEENSDVKTISLEKAVENFENYAKSEYTYVNLDRMGVAGNKVKITVDTIRCRMMRIKIKDNSDEFYMIPAWEFLGTATYDGMDVGRLHFATINAIDGSLIDVYLGY